MNASTRTTALAALAAGLATSACTTGDRTPTTVITIAPAPAVPPASADTEPADTEPLVTVDVPLGLDTTTADDPSGTPVQFAVRYLNDLRAGRWDAALDEMAYVERVAVDLTGSAAAVGRDVLRNATGDHGRLAACTSGRQFASDAVIVRCGGINVVVHVETLGGFRGVKVSDVFVNGDHPGRPHTHASTRLV